MGQGRPARDAGTGMVHLIQQQCPGTGWLRLDHDTLATLAAYKAFHGFTTSEAAVTDLLARAREVVA